MKITQMGENCEVLREDIIDPSKCPHQIWAAEHYREDGSCKCNDPNEKIMRKWGYRWNRKKGLWW